MRKTKPAAIGTLVYDPIQHKAAVTCWVLFTAIAVFNAADIGTTALALHLGAREANPMVAWIIDHIWVVAAAKAVVLTSVGLSLKKIRPRTNAVAPLGVVTGIYAMTIISNLITIASL